MLCGEYFCGNDGMNIGLEETNFVERRKYIVRQMISQPTRYKRPVSRVNMVNRVPVLGARLTGCLAAFPATEGINDPSSSEHFQFKYQ